MSTRSPPIRLRPTTSLKAARPQKRSIASVPMSSTTRGRTSASSASSHGAQSAISGGDGRRSPLRSRLSRESLRDRRAVRQMRFVDAGLGEPATQLRARASRERKSGPELDRTGRLADGSSRDRSLCQRRSGTRRAGSPHRRIACMRGCGSGDADVRIQTQRPLMVSNICTIMSGVRVDWRTSWRQRSRKSIGLISRGLRASSTARAAPSRARSARGLASTN